MKKGLIIFSILTCLSGSLMAATTGKYDKVNKETYNDYLERKSALADNISGKFGNNLGANAYQLTFSQAHIKCTNDTKMVSSSSSCTTDNCVAGASAGDMKVDLYNACMANYAPFKDEQEDVGSCAPQTIEWGQYGSGNTCSADIGSLDEASHDSLSNGKVVEGGSILIMNQNTSDSYQGFAKITCEAGNIEILDSKCTLVPDPCYEGDTVGDPDKLPARYKENDNWQNSHLWPVTEPSWAKPSAGPHFITGDPRNIDRSKEFKDKVQSGERENYCYATLDSSNNGTLATAFPIQSGDMIVNPEIANSDAFFDKDNTNGVWRCFDGEFYNEGSSCQYETQSCDPITVPVSNGKGEFCEFKLPFQKHNAIFTERNPTPENSIGQIKAFCWDGQWEIWEESCNLSCENDFSGDSWNAEDGDPQNCNHAAKTFGGRTAPTSILTLNNENPLMDGSKSYKCDNGEWVDQSQSCIPKNCSYLPANSWNSTVENDATCTHNALDYSTPHNKTISTSANNGSNATVGYISYQCRYGQFVDITDYSGAPEYEPTQKGFSPSDKHCASTIDPPICYFDLDKTEPSEDPTIFIDDGDGCYIECSVNNLTGAINCVKSCTNDSGRDPDTDCLFAGGFSGCPAKNWYSAGTEIHCATWKLKPQICSGGSWAEKSIVEKKWASKTVTSFTEYLGKDEHIDSNVKPIVSVDFGLVYNNFTKSNQYGYGNSASNAELDSGVSSGSGTAACDTNSYATFNASDTTDYCFTKAVQSNVRDWKLFYEGGAGCSISGASSGEWTTNNISVSCASELGYNAATANATFVIRYTDGTILTSPKITLSASINVPVTPAGYCGKIADVTNIQSGDSGQGCETTVAFSNDIQSGNTAVIRELRTVYVGSTCLEVEYTGNLDCVDKNSAANYEDLQLEGSISCVSNPIPAFNCGVSEMPEWETPVSLLMSKPSETSEINIPAPNNSGVAYTSSAGFIDASKDTIGCDTYSTNCTTKLLVQSGNEIESWSLAQIDNNTECTFRNSNNTYSISTGTWYNEGAKLSCNFSNVDSLSFILDFKLKDGTVVRSEAIRISAKP